MPTDIHSIRRNVASRIKGKLSEYGLELVECGSKNKELTQPISSENGYWSESSFNSKPSRLIVHINITQNTPHAELPEANHNRTFAYANTGEHRSVGGLIVRVVPVFVVEASDQSNATRSYNPHPEWEWALWFVFSPKLRSGTSGEVFNHLDPSTGTFQYKSGTQEYVASGLVALLPDDELFTTPDGANRITYKQATDALASLIHTSNTMRLAEIIDQPEVAPNA